MYKRQVLEQLLLQHPDTDGIFASSDLIAAQLLQVCAKLGRKVPEQLKIVGFDDVNIASLTTPPITTIHQPIKEMAATAVELLVLSLIHIFIQIYMRQHRNNKQQISWAERTIRYGKEEKMGIVIFEYTSIFTDIYIYDCSTGKCSTRIFL